MSHDIRHISSKTGLPPGALMHVGNLHHQPMRLRLFRYSDRDWQEYELTSLEDMPESDPNYIAWLNVDGLHDIALIKTIGEHYKLHPLLLEDILNTKQRPKFDDLEDYLYLVFKDLAYDEDEQNIRIEQISIIIGPNYVISFQETEGDLFDGIRDRIRLGKGRIRKMKPDYLAYSMLDVTIDNYFVVLETLHEKIELLQQNVLLQPPDSIPKDIHDVRQKALIFRKITWPVRQLIEQLQKSESSLIDEALTAYLRDAWDHIVRITEAVDVIQDMLSNAMETYLSLTNQKTNQVMRLLTVVATIFMPLTFITSVYGMNFQFMPELHWRYSYPILWICLFISGAAMYIYFKRKKWF